MKNTLIIACVIVDAALLVLSLVLMLAGYLLWGAVALLAAGGLVFAAARFWLNTPEPPAAPVEWLIWDEPLGPELSDLEHRMLAAGLVPIDPIDRHAAQMARALNDLPEQHLLQPQRPSPRHRRDNTR